MQVMEPEILTVFAGNKIAIPSPLRAMTPEEEDSCYTAMTEWMQSEDRGCFRILTAQDGDKRVTWSRMVLAEIAAAKRMFMDLLTHGMVPYRVGVNGEASSEVMQEFDPTAEEVIFLPVNALRGG